MKKVVSKQPHIHLNYFVSKSILSKLLQKLREIERQIERQIDRGRYREIEIER